MTPDNNQLTADIWNWYIFTVKESFNVYITSLHMKKADTWWTQVLVLINTFS